MEEREEEEQEEEEEGDMTGPRKEEMMKTARSCNLRSISPVEALLAISALFSLIFLADALSSEIKIQVKSRDLRPINLNKASKNL